MPRLDAYWISPDGKALSVPQTHIDMIHKAPQKFGESKKSLSKEYEKYGEVERTEGKAREKIIIRIMKRGFTRIREHKLGWSIEVWKLTDKVKKQIYGWAKKVKVRDKYADVAITQIGDLKVPPIRTVMNKIQIGYSADVKPKRLFADVYEEIIFTDDVFLLEDLEVERAEGGVLDKINLVLDESKFFLDNNNIEYRMMDDDDIMNILREGDIIE